VHEDFIMQTGGQVSSAPVRRGSGVGRECLAPTRASSASSSSSTPGRSHGARSHPPTPLPTPTEERVFLHSFAQGSHSRK
jgi:hypothetical protein